MRSSVDPIQDRKDDRTGSREHVKPHRHEGISISWDALNEPKHDCSYHLRNVCNKKIFAALSSEFNSLDNFNPLDNKIPAHRRKKKTCWDA